MPRFRLGWPIVWKQYKKTLIPMQIFILAVCIWLYGTKRVSLGGTILVFLGMQLANSLGAWWAAHIRRQIERSDQLPLE